MYIHRDKKFGFICHPRTASRSTHRVLLDLGCTAHGNHHDFDADLCLEYISAGGLISSTKRNIFDVIVSWYHNLLTLPKGHRRGWDTFDQYVKACVYDEAHSWLSDPLYHYGLPYCNHVIDFTELGTQLPVLTRFLKLGEKPLPRMGITEGRKPYREYYNDYTRGFVEGRWAQDLELTGYEF